MGIPGKKRNQMEPANDPVWRRIKASDQAAYKLNLMLAEMEYESRHFDKAAIYYLAALKTYFRTDVYKLTMQSIRQISGNRQNKFLYKLGKCLLFHCHQSELAQATLDKLSILDPSFLKPVQKIFQLYEDENSPDRRELLELIEQTSRTRRVIRPPAEKNVPSAPQPAVPGVTAGKTPVPGPPEPAEKEKEDDGIEMELRISFEETGEHFTVQKDLPESTTIDKETLDDLMDSLLTDE